MDAVWHNFRLEKKRKHIRDLEEKWRQKLGHEKVLEEICEELGALGPDTKSSLTKTKPRASAKQPAKWF